MKDSHERCADGFLQEPIGRLLVRNCGPAMASMLVMALYQIVDGAMVGRRLGPDALAAVNILYPVIALLVGLAVMIGVGANAKVAVLLGAGRTIEARGVFSLAAALGTGLGVVGTVVVIVRIAPLTSALGASEAVSELARTYLLTMAPFFTAYILTFILDQAMRNDGHAGLATAVMACGAFLNIALDYLFLFVLDLGIGGAALASAVGQGFTASFFIGYFALKSIRRHHGLRFTKPAGGLRTVAAIATNGSSELLGSLALGVVTLLFNRALMSHLGAIGVAAFALVQYVLMLSAVFFNALGTGSQPIVSRNHGAGLPSRVSATLRTVLGAGCAIGVLLAVGVWTAAEHVASLFVPDHPDAVALTADAIRIVAWSIPAAAVGTIGSVFFTSIERAGRSLLIAALRGLIVPVAMLAAGPLLWGATGIWFVPVVTELAGLAVTAVMLVTWSGASVRSHLPRRGLIRAA